MVLFSPLGTQQISLICLSQLGQTIGVQTLAPPPPCYGALDTFTFLGLRFLIYKMEVDNSIYLMELQKDEVS